MSGSLSSQLRKGGLWVVLGSGFTSCANLLIFFLLGRLLSEQDFAEYGTAHRLALLLGILVQLGIAQTWVRLIPQAQSAGEPGRARGVIRLGLRLVAISSVVMIAFLLLGGGRWLMLQVLGSPALAMLLLVVTAWIVLRAFEVLLSEGFRGFKDLLGANLFGGVLSSALLLTGFATIFFLPSAGGSLQSLMWIQVGALAVGVTLGAVVFLARSRALGPATAVDWKPVMAISLPLCLNTLTTFGFVYADVLIVRSLAAADAADYIAGARLVEFVTRPLTLVNLLVPPFISSLYFSGDRERLQRLLRTAATLAGLPAALVLIGLVVFGGTILGWMNPELKGGAIILTILGVGRLINVFTGSCGITMAMTGHQNTLVRITLVNSVLTIVAMLLVVRPYGGVGVAVVVSVGIAVQNLWMWWSTHHHTGLWTHVGLPTVSDMRRLLKR